MIYLSIEYTSPRDKFLHYCNLIALSFGLTGPALNKIVGNQELHLQQDFALYTVCIYILLVIFCPLSFLIKCSYSNKLKSTLGDNKSVVTCRPKTLSRA